LLENAVKFSSSGTIRVTLEIAEGAAVLAVEDQGPGVPPEALLHLFDRFYQARVEDRRQGSGLGLAIVAAVARWHAGVVGVENRPEGGARFWLRIPLANVAPSISPAELTS
jgi:signal transduction histidine kinase